MISLYFRRNNEIYIENDFTCYSYFITSILNYFMHIFATRAAAIHERSWNGLLHSVISARLFRIDGWEKKKLPEAA